MIGSRQPDAALMGRGVHDETDERAEIRRLVRELGASGGDRTAAPDEVARLRDFFGRRVLRPAVDAYIQAKYDQHVGRRHEWPDDTEPEEYLESLRETVLDPRSGIYLTDHGGDGEWSIYFVGHVRRAWQGASGSSRIFVAFNAERHLLITGFQPLDGDSYVMRQEGFWVYRR
jgi:hypothetical protein